MVFHPLSGRNLALKGGKGRGTTHKIEHGYWSQEEGIPPREAVWDGEEIFEDLQEEEDLEILDDGSEGHDQDALESTKMINKEEL